MRLGAFGAGSPNSGELTIVGPDGRPAAGAVTGLAFYVFTGDLNPPGSPYTQQFRADSNGIVRIPVSTPRKKLVAFHASGCAEIEPDVWTRGGRVKPQLAAASAKNSTTCCRFNRLLVDLLQQVMKWQ
jgi:hypothetical protein